MLYGILWVMSLIAISFYGGTISYGFFGGLTLIPVVSIIYMIFVYWRMFLYQEVIIKHIECRNAIPYYFVIQNDDMIAFSSVSVILYSNFSTVEDMPDNIEYEIMPGEKYRFETNLTCMYRGEYHIGIKEIVIKDFFNLFTIKYRIPSPIKATVLPRVIKLKELISIPDIAAYLQKETFLQDVELDVQVRDYMQGDSIKRIHWKASAKEQNLKVRNLIGEEKQGIGFLCDTRRVSEQMKEYLPIENKILEMLLALSFYFAQNNTNINLIYEQSGLKKLNIDGAKSFGVLYNEVSNINFNINNNAAQMMCDALSRGLFINCKVVFLVLSEIDTVIMGEAQKLSQGGSIVIIYVVTDRNISQYITLSTLRLKIFQIPIESDLGEVL